MRGGDDLFAEAGAEALCSGRKSYSGRCHGRQQHLHSVLTLNKGAIKPSRRLEAPTKTRSQVLTALRHRINDSGVLQPIAA